MVTTTKNQLRQHRPLKMKQFDNNDLTAGGGSWYDVNKDESNEKQSQLESSKRLGFQRDFVSNLGFFPYSSRSRRSTALNIWNKKKSTGDNSRKNNDDDDDNDSKVNKIGSWFVNKINNNNSDSTGKTGVGNNSDTTDDDDKNSVLLIWYKFTSKVDGIKEEVLQKLISTLPAPLIEFLTNIFTKIKSVLPSLKLAFLSFAAGAVLTLAAILVPVYSSVESLSQPVTLFETILADLDRGYVDPVDTNKLFETGISAMLRSLDPYTEYQAREEAEQMNEGITGRYGGVGLVISGATPRDLAEMKKITDPGTKITTQQQLQNENTPKGNKLLPDDAIQDSMGNDDNNNDNNNDNSGGQSSSSTNDQGGNNGKTNFVDESNSDIDDEDDEEDKFTRQKRKEQLKAVAKAQEKGIRVVSAFEGYAFDYGMRTGDKLTKVDDLVVTPTTTVEDVRNVLRGEPGKLVNIQFLRDGTKGIQDVTMPRAIVRLRDVKLATLVGKPSDGIGYISLSGFAQSAGNEVRGAILALEQAAEESSNGAHSLKGLILDMRGNPGGLLTSAVDVASLLVPNGSDIVSAKGRGFPGVSYRSRVEPILDSKTKLTVLVNRGTASAAEIVSGAVQDLDVGIIVGTDRTFGKGLVQNVQDLPFNTALKFTVAKYYTPSGRCIQSVNYKEGGGLGEQDGKYQSSNISKKDRQVFYTKSGRTVRDGGGVEADFKVPAPKASALEITLLRSDVMNEYASQWSQKYELTNNFEVTDDVYREFQDFVEVKRKAGDLKFEALYTGALDDLKRALSQSGYKASEREVEQLKTQIVKEIKNDFEKYKKDIKEDIAISILSRYIPESMIMERGLKTDTQVQEAIKLLNNDKSFSKILANGSNNQRSNGSMKENSVSVASSVLDENEISREGASFRLKW